VFSISDGTLIAFFISLDTSIRELIQSVSKRLQRRVMRIDLKIFARYRHLFSRARRTNHPLTIDWIVSDTIDVCVRQITQTVRR